MQKVHARNLYIGTEAERGSTTPSSDGVGLLFWCTDTTTMYVWDGSNWLQVSVGGLSQYEIPFADASGFLEGDPALEFNKTSEQLKVEGDAIGFDGKSELYPGYFYMYMWALQPFIQLFRANGSPGSESAINSGDVIGRLSFSGHSGSGFTGALARLQAVANENYDGSNQGTRLELYATLDGATGASLQVTIYPDRVTLEKFLNFGAPSTLTISSGEVTAIKSYHRIDTQGAASSDDLDTINGGSDGDVLVLKSVSDARVVVLKDGTGNLSLEGSADVSLIDPSMKVLLVYDGDLNNWCMIPS